MLSSFTKRVDYLGRGLAYPVAVTPRGRLLVTGGPPLIAQSIARLLSTPQGSRFFNRAYGSQLHTLHYEPNDLILTRQLDVFIVDAIEQWERRVTVEDIAYTVTAAQVTCTITVRLTATGQLDTFVFPFYREITT